MNKFFVGALIAALALAGCNHDPSVPAEVGNLTADPGDGQVTLKWADPTDFGFAKVQITYTNGTAQSKEVAKGIQTAAITGLTNGTEYTFVVRAVDTFGNTSTGKTVTATPVSGGSGGPPPPPPPSSLDSITAVNAAIDEAVALGHGGLVTDSILLTMAAAFDLGNMAAGSGWDQLLTTLGTKGKFVTLDLSACTMSGTVFAPYNASATGKAQVVSLTLPNAAQTMAVGTSSNPTFRYFTALKTVSGANITAVSNYAFYNCAALTSASFPLAASIGESAFQVCYALTSASFPQATFIDGFAFTGCAALTSASFPLAASIGNYAFNSCTALATFTLGATPPTLGTAAFTGSTPDNFTIKRPSASASAYTAWVGGANAAKFNSSGSSIQFANSL